MPKFIPLSVIAQSYQGTSPIRKTEMLSSVILLLIIVLFWLWLMNKPNFAVGVVTSSHTMANQTSLIELSNPVQTRYVLNRHSLMTVDDGDWVLSHGIPNTASATELLIVEDDIESVQWLFSKATLLLELNNQAWILNALKQYDYFAVILAGLFLLFSNRMLHFGYVLFLSSVTIFSTWHMLHIANWLHLFQFDEITLVLVLLLSMILAVRWSVLHSKLLIVERLMSSVLWWFVGASIISWLGWEHGDTWFLAIFIGAFFFPWLTTSFLAAFLLGLAFHANGMGAYVLLLATTLLSLILLDQGRTKKRIRGDQI